MKKNVMMRIASILVVAVLLTTCVISGTFAKYVTSGEAEDSARVAKFGVTVTGESDLFSTKYEKDDDTYVHTQMTVESSNSDKLVAPGTKGSLAQFGLTGTPEVAVRVSYEVTEFELENWAINTEFYCPLLIGIDNGQGENYINGLNYESADAFGAAVKEAIEAVSEDFAAGTDLSTVVDHGIKISWHWNFEGTTGSVNNQDDIKDTYLGDRAAEGAAATIKLAVACKVTQID